MQRLLVHAHDLEATAVFNAEVTGIEKIPGGFLLTSGSDHYQFQSRLVINCAGLSSDAVAALAGIDRDKAEYRLHFCKGDYFRCKKPLQVRHLVYPVPQAHGLGVHITPDLAGGVRFGPDTEYVRSVAYAIDERKRDEFCAAAQKYLPRVSPEDFYPDTSGIRPKLQGEHDGFRDFVIRHEADRGLEGLIDLVGIDSPGLTSSIAIAEYVETMMKNEGLIS